MSSLSTIVKSDRKAAEALIAQRQQRERVHYLQDQIFLAVRYQRPDYEVKALLSQLEAAVKVRFN